MAEEEGEDEGVAEEEGEGEQVEVEVQAGEDEDEGRKAGSVRGGEVVESTCWRLLHNVDLEGRFETLIRTNDFLKRELKEDCLMEYGFIILSEDSVSCQESP